MTDKEPTKEQIKELWEWCGIYQDASGWWVYPDGIARRKKPILDLNNLFKYAVPKLFPFGSLECSFHREIAMFGDNGELLKERRISFRWRLLLESQILTPIDGYGDTPALALFWAIWEVIKK